MTHRLHLDYETRSAVDLKKTGVYVYGADRTTDVWCAAYALDEGPIELWTPGQAVPREITAAVEEGWEMVAFNAAFERILTYCVMHYRYGWPVPKLEQWRCVMAMALAMALPGSLENAAAAVGLPFAKDMEGHGLMMRMAKPRRPRKGEDPAGIFWWDDEPRRLRLYDYCRQDVRVERELEKRLLPLRPSEQRLWWLDQRINDRGVFVDVDLAEAAKKVVGTAARWLDDEMREVTRGAVSACSNVGEITEWLDRNGVATDSISKDVIDELLLRKDLSADARRVLELRREAAKASVTKIDALLRGRNADGRARGLLQFHAASTGRWAGRRFQPQNLKRPDLDEGEIPAAIDAVATGNAETVQLLYGEPLSVVGDCLRGMIRAAPGKKIVAADLANIEGRVTAWLAGEKWKLQAFRDFDAGRGPDLYLVTAGGILGKRPEDVTKAERQTYGKVPELACGFQGGVGAFQKMAETYGVKIPDEQADEIKEGWRSRHPETVQTWYDLEAAALTAVREKGKVVECGRVRFRVAGSFLFLRLPSGRTLAYPYPRVVDKLMPWGKWKPAVCYKGVDSYTRKWTDCYAYGGLWMENLAQAIARDVLAEGMVRAELAGYPIILSVHDELVAEPRADFGSSDQFEQIMSTLPAWAEGLPVAASGFEAERYRK